MTLKDALDQRIPRIRRPIWSNPNAYLRLPLCKDGYGPWAELYDDGVQLEVLNIEPGSQKILVFTPDDTDDYERYDGPASAYEQSDENYASSYLER